MNLKTGKLARVALLAATMVLSSAPTTPAGFWVEIGCGNPPNPLNCFTEAQFICIGGNSDCHLLIRRFGGSDPAAGFDYRFAARVHGGGLLTDSGRIAFAKGETTAAVLLTTSDAVISVVVQVSAGGVVLHEQTL